MYYLKLAQVRPKNFSNKNDVVILAQMSLKQSVIIMRKIFDNILSRV